MTVGSGPSTLVSAMLAATVYDLEQPRYEGAPTFTLHSPGSLYMLHRRHEPGAGRTSASGRIFAAEHSGTHIDALCHQAFEMKMFGGHAVDAETQTASGFTELGVETIGPILRRGVLIDVGDRGPSSDGVTAEELEAAATEQGISVAADDVVLVRTGNGAQFLDPPNYLKNVGMAPSASQWLADRNVFAVGADNVAWDSAVQVDPRHGTLPGHRILIVDHGIYILENLNLEELAQARVPEFLFVCLPLKLVGATGSPVRPLAVVGG